MLYTSQKMPEKRKYFQLRGLWVRSGPGKFQASCWNMPCDGMCDEKTSYYDPVCPSSVCRSVCCGWVHIKPDLVQGCVHPSGLPRKLAQARAQSHGGGAEGAEARRYLHTPGAGQLLVGALQLPLRRLREFLQRPLVPVGLATSPLGVATTVAGIAAAIAIAGGSIRARGGCAFRGTAIAGLLLCGTCRRQRPSRASRRFLVSPSKMARGPPLSTAGPTGLSRGR